MKKDSLRLLSILLFFAVFEAAVCVLLFTEFERGPNASNSWVANVALFDLNFVILSQVALLAIWAGLGPPAMLQRVFYTVSCCLAGLLIPALIMPLFVVLDAEFVWSSTLLVLFVFTSCFVCCLIFGQLFRRRLAVLNEMGVASFVMKSQFGLGFMLTVTLTVAVLSLLCLACLPTDLVDEVEIATTAVFFGSVGGLICFVQGIALAWIFLQPKSIQSRMFAWLATAYAALIGLLLITWYVVAIPWDTSAFFIILTAFATFLGSSVVFIVAMRILDYRLVRIDQIGLRVKDPAAAHADFVGAIHTLIGQVFALLRKPWVAGPIVVVLGWLAYDWFLFDGRIRVSKETTYLTEPLRADGMVDYGAAINERMSFGVKPEDNAAVDFIWVLGPRVVHEDCAEQFYRWLGMEPLPSDGDYIVFYEDFPEAIAELASAKPKGPPPRGVLWSADQYPVAAAWLDANREQLEIVRAASRKPHFFVPIVTPNDELLINDFGLTSFCRDLVLMLDADAMYELQRGNWRAALDDIAAIGRIGQLIMRRGTAIDWLTGKMLLGIKQGLQLTLIEQITAQDLDEFVRLSEQLHLQPIVSLRNSCGFTERLLFLDMMVYEKKTNLGIFRYMRQFGPNSSTQPLATQLCRSSDWNEILRVCNESWNEYEAALNISDRVTRLARLNKLENGGVSYEEQSFSYLFPHFLWTRQTRGRGIAALLIGYHMPQWEIYESAGVTIESQRDVDEISLALEAFRAAKGMYPTSLNELSPVFLKEIPLDRFNGKPYSYKLEPGGYLVYGVGRNLIDNQGDAAKDIVARINRAKGN